jgi:AcrR family transcriptional regulator
MKILDPVNYQIRKEAILQQARHLFATKGYAETSMDDIARANHIQKASLYHYFKSKQKILEEMIELEGQRWAAQLKDYAGTDLKDCLAHIGRTFLKNLDEPARREFFQIILFESHKNPIIMKALKENPTFKRGLVFGVITPYLQDRLSSTQIASVAMQFMGGIIHYARLSRLHGENLCLEKVTDDDYIEQLVRTTAHGVEAL